MPKPPPPFSLKDVPDPDRVTLVERDPGVTDVQPIPGMEVCDFCSSEEPAKVFGCAPIREMVVRTTQAGLQEHVSDEDWLACATCARLIERGERKKLARRCVREFVAKHPEARALPEAKLRRDFLAVQGRFFANRRPADDRMWRRR